MSASNFRVLLLGFLTALAALGQSSLGTITGTVTDPAGAPTPNVTITARAAATSLTYKGITNESGVYVIPNVPIGEFSVTAEANGFKKIQRSGVTVEVSQRLRLDFTLEIGNVTEAVDVKAEIPRIQVED
jgi:hypothetical protein